MRRSSLLVASVALLALPSCGGAPGSTGEPAATPPRVTHVLPRGGESTASVHVLPDATCTLTLPGATGHLELYSDDEGIVRVHLRHLDPTVTQGELQLDCADDAGNTDSHILDVRVDEHALPVAPAPFRREGRPSLPALDGDPMALASADLVARGYPPRPDPQRAPAQYTSWLELVTSGAAITASHTLRRNVVAAGAGVLLAQAAATSSNWSGYTITTPESASEYDWIFGQWSVPQVHPASNFWSLDGSSLFVGLDGWGSLDVVQAGTDQDTVTSFWLQTSSYNAFIGWSPGVAQQVPSDFPVNPGDTIYAWVWMRDASGDASPDPTVAWFYLWNATENIYTEQSIAAAAGTTFQGHSAEWILQRPSGYGLLANYQSTQISGALAYDLAGAEHFYSSESSLRVSMTNGADLLSTVMPVSSSTMQFTFVAAQ